MQNDLRSLTWPQATLATADREPYFYSVTRGGVLGAQRLNGLPPRAPCGRARGTATGRPVVAQRPS